MSDPAEPYEIAQALASQLETTLGPLIEHLQVCDLWENNPTPPTIDIYPSVDGFQETITYTGYNEFFFDIRVRVLKSDLVGGQLLLYSLMSPFAATSLAKAIRADRTLGGAVSQAFVVSGPTGFGEFLDAGGQMSLLGCTWRVQVTP